MSEICSHRFSARERPGVVRGRLSCVYCGKVKIKGTPGMKKLVKRKKETGDLQARCWCDSAFVWVPATDVRSGLTGSCGRPDCSQDSVDIRQRPA